jgi:hypothetical protein
MPYQFTTHATGFVIALKPLSHSGPRRARRYRAGDPHAAAGKLARLWTLPVLLACEGAQRASVPADAPARKHDWKQLLTQDDPMVVAIQRRVFATTLINFAFAVKQRSTG